MAPRVGFEHLIETSMVGDEGFEPPRGGVKVRCLTAWLIPNARAEFREKSVFANTVFQMKYFF